jgi:hypothetical protein
MGCASSNPRFDIAGYFTQVPTMLIRHPFEMPTNRRRQVARRNSKTRLVSCLECLKHRLPVIALTAASSPAGRGAHFRAKRMNIQEEEEEEEGAEG